MALLNSSVTGPINQKSGKILACIKKLSKVFSATIVSGFNIKAKLVVTLERPILFATEYPLLPPVKIHCSVLAEDAIKAAVNDYYQKNDSKKEIA